MGFIICQKHSEQGIVSGVSIDICQAIWDDSKTISIKEIYIVLVEVFDDDNEEELLFTDITYISDFYYKNLRLDSRYIIRNEQDEVSLNNTLPKTSGVCGKCLKEFIKNFDIKVIE